MTSSGPYKRYLGMLRVALQECCGLSKQEAEMYALHSLRRGGNTEADKPGMSAALRLQAMGSVTRTMAKEYRQAFIEEQLTLAKASWREEEHTMRKFGFYKP